MLIRDNPVVAARTQTVAAKVETVLEKTPEVLMQEKIVATLFAARKSHKEKNIIMSASEQNNFFVLCHSLFLKEETIVCDNPGANIGPLKKYLALI